MAIELGEACVFVSIFRSYVQSKSRRRGACVPCLLPMGAVDAHVSSNMFLCSSFYMETVRQWKNKGIKHFCDEMFSIAFYGYECTVSYYFIFLNVEYYCRIEQTFRRW